MADSGGFVNREGMYHMEVSDVEFKLDRAKTYTKDGKEISEPATPHVILKMKVLQTVEGQSPEGTGYWHRVFLKEKGGDELSDGKKKGLVKQLVRLGLLRLNDAGGLIVASSGQPGFPGQQDYEGLRGRQYIVQIDRRPPKKEKGYDESFSCSWGIALRHGNPGESQREQ